MVMACYGNIMAQSQQIFDCGEALALDVDEKMLLGPLGTMPMP